MVAHPPLATYRLQLNKAFGFRDAERLVPYVQRLGVTHVYASPIFAAKAGSIHGYDVTDPTRLNTELGTETDFQSLQAALGRAGLGLILDIVPNHMAADVTNPWWKDVLAHGRSSRFASYFDIDWDSAGGKLVLPLLGKPIDEALRHGDVQVVEEDGNHHVAYFEKRWPVSSGSADLARKAATGDREALIALLDMQAYRLAHFQEPPNYRRFFDINDLASVRVEDEEVFNATHALILRLVKGGVGGLRVDHIDGLLDPAGYLKRLRAAVGSGTYLVVEKILGEGESLPAGWPVEGTTGYEFLAEINGLFADQEGVEKLGIAYARFTSVEHDFEHEVRGQKRRILDLLFSNEIESLSRQLGEALEDLGMSDVPVRELVQVLKDLIVEMPVYRTYADASGMPTDGRRLLSDVCSRLREGATGERLQAVNAVCLVLTLDYPDGLPLPRREAWAAAVMRWQQLSGPATAKGLEDTAFYRYNRLISLNEVGGHAEPHSPGHVHEFLAARARQWPHSMNASSTHDTKRSEDVRARINGLSWMADEWTATVARWREWNARWKRQVDGAAMPDANMEWLLYQTLVGMWPLSQEEEPELLPRLQRFLTKAAREAKEHTSWLNVSEPYEEALLGFAEALLDPERSATFLGELRGIVRRVAPLGAVASLAQLTIKATAPGLPDIYQGQELWDLSMTDPDNRRPVDYSRREALLEKLGGAHLSDLVEHWDDGRVKLYVTYTLLQLRRQKLELMRAGEYLALDGGDASVFAFARRHGNDWLITVAPRSLSLASVDGKLPLGRQLAQGAGVAIPPEAPTRWRDIFTGAIRTSAQGRYPMDTLFDSFPIALLVSETE